MCVVCVCARARVCVVSAQPQISHHSHTASCFRFWSDRSIVDPELSNQATSKMMGQGLQFTPTLEQCMKLQSMFCDCCSVAHIQSSTLHFKSAKISGVKVSVTCVHAHA